MKFFDNLFDLNNRDEQLVTGLNKELNSVYVYDYFNKYNNNILLVTNSLYEANDLYNRLSNYTDRVLFFPMDDFMTSEASIISPELMIERLNTLNKLVNNDNYIVVTNLMGYLRFLPSKEIFSQNILKYKVSDVIEIKDLINLFDKLGYKRETTVNKTKKTFSHFFIYFTSSLL